ncbi:MAG: Ig-like domain-containing protein [Pseudomonadota bacterium]
MKLAIGVSLTAASPLFVEQSIAPDPQVPEAFSVADWTLADVPSIAGNRLSVTVSALPGDGGAPISSIEYRIGDGAWTTLGILLGTIEITVLALTPSEITLRAVNAVGPGPAGDSQTVTPTQTAPPPASEQVYFGANTASGAGQTPIVAADGLYAGGALRVEGNVLTRVAGQTPVPGEYDVDGILVTVLADAVSAATTDDVLAQLTATKFAGTTTTLVIVGEHDLRAYDFTGLLSGRTNGFTICAARPREDGVNYLRPSIQIAGISNLTLKNLCIQQPNDEDLAAWGSNRVQNLVEVVGNQPLEALIIEDCLFSSSLEPAAQGGRQIHWHYAVSVANGRCNNLVIRGSTFQKMTHAISCGAAQFTIEDCLADKLWGDFINLTHGAGNVTTRSFIRNNHMQNIASDNSGLHSDWIQFVASANVPIQNVDVYGNTLGLGEITSLQGGQAEHFDAIRNGTTTTITNTTLSTTTAGNTHLIGLTDGGANFTVTLPAGASLPVGATYAGKSTGTFGQTFYTATVHIDPGDAYVGTRHPGGTVTLTNGEQFFGFYWNGTAWDDQPGYLGVYDYYINSDQTVVAAYDHRALYVDAANGPVTITLPAATTGDIDVFVKKIDTTPNIVTIALSGGTFGVTRGGGAAVFTSTTPEVLTQCGETKQFVTDGTSTTWNCRYTGQSMQGLFANPHAFANIFGNQPGYRDIRVYGNILFTQSPNGLAVEEAIGDGLYLNNTLIQVTPPDSDGDGVVGFLDGLNASAGTIVVRGEMTAMRNFTTGSISVLDSPANGIPSDQMLQDNIALQMADAGVTDLTTSYATYLNGTVASAYTPTSREEVVAAARAKSSGPLDTHMRGAVGTTATNGFYNWETGAPNPVQRPGVSFASPGQGANSVALGTTQIVVWWDWPIHQGTGSITLTDLTTASEVPGYSVSHKGNRTDITLSAPLEDGHEYEVIFAPDAVVHALDPSQGSLAIGSGQWRFTASFAAQTDILVVPAEGFEGLIMEEGQALSSGYRFDQSGVSISGDVTFSVFIPTISSTTASIRFWALSGSSTFAGRDFNVAINAETGQIISDGGMGARLQLDPEAGGVRVSGLLDMDGANRYIFELNRPGFGSAGAAYAQSQLAEGSFLGMPWAPARVAWM